ncbi:MAG: hypothetical protein R3F22_00775 [Lysobacteraceae bacterium]
MSSKEDILEQLVEEYLIHNGYFVRHNIKFRPRKEHPDFDTRQDSNHSDIDVLGFHPRLRGEKKVIAVSCKSWQSGFRPESRIREISENRIVNGREAWRGFRELHSLKWAEAFIDAVERETGQRRFHYVTAVTRLNGSAATWETHEPFLEKLQGNPIHVWELRDMLTAVWEELGTTVASTEFGRTLQLFKAAGIRIETA